MKTFRTLLLLLIAILLLLIGILFARVESGVPSLAAEPAILVRLDAGALATDLAEALSATPVADVLAQCHPDVRDLVALLHGRRLPVEFVVSYDHADERRTARFTLHPGLRTISEVVVTRRAGPVSADLTSPQSIIDSLEQLDEGIRELVETAMQSPELLDLRERARLQREEVDRRILRDRETTPPPSPVPTP